MFTLVLDKKSRSVTMIDASNNISVVESKWIECSNQLILQVNPMVEVKPIKTRKKKRCFSGPIIKLSDATLFDIQRNREIIEEQLGVHRSTIDSWLKRRTVKKSCLEEIYDAIALVEGT